MVSFDVGSNIRGTIGEAVYELWSDLDHLLVQFWESRSIRPRIGCFRVRGVKRNMDYCVGCLLPEITKRGIVDLI